MPLEATALDLPALTRFQFLMNRHLFLKIPLSTLIVKRPAEMLSGKEFLKLHLTKT